MKKSIGKFLQFNGRTLYFLNKDGQYWVAIRPIVEALKIDYTWQLAKLKKHPIWGDVYGKSPMRDSKNRLQEMVALPEKYIYLWIAQLPIKTEGHSRFVKECVDVLYEYFHGTLTQRREILSNNADLKVEQKQLETTLSDNSTYKRLMKVKSEIMLNGKGLKNLDTALIKEQMAMFDQ